MKINAFKRGMPSLWLPPKILLIMRLIIIIMTGFFLQVSASSFGQRISLSEKNAPLEQILKKIKAQTGFEVLYASDLIAGSKRINVNLFNTALPEALKVIFKNQPLTFELKDRTIVVKRMPSSSFMDQAALAFRVIDIHGIVLDEQGLPMVGALVKVQGSNNVTYTNEKGSFSLSKVDEKASLLISYIGYEDIILAAAENLGTIKMVQANSNLNEVVVIGYGQVKKGDITGSLTTIKPDDFNKGRIVTAQDALVGKIAGLSVVPGSGVAGSSGTIRIRMGASLSATNDPLLVIDGIPVNGTDINSINPNDIATFTVLKDASATAIYGSRASNGVIVITTKKGNANGSGKPAINYNNNFTFSHLYDYLDVLSADEFRTAFSAHATAPATFQLGEVNTDWQKEIYRVAFGQEHNLSVTGSLKKMPYRVSAGYTNQGGIIKTDNYGRLNAGFGITPKFFDKHLSVDLNVKGSNEDRKSVSTGVIGSAISFDPTRPVHASYPNNVGLGYFTWMTTAGTPISLAAVNPVSELELKNNSNNIKRSIGNVALDYKTHFLEDLHFNLNAGYDVSKQNIDNVNPQFAPAMYTSNRNDGTGENYLFNQTDKNYLLDVYANYNKELGKSHKIQAMAGYGWQHFWYGNQTRTNDTFGNELVTPMSSEGELYLLSFYGRLNYAYANKYLITATLRADASSRFSKENRWGYFPSVALGWKINEEDFLKDNAVVSDLKLRVSYGATGQQGIGSYYQHQSVYKASQDEARYLFGDQWYTTYRPNGYDPNIKWETTNTYNFGLDYGFMANRIYGSVDYYTRNTIDLLNDIYVPAGSNFTNRINTNIGNMKSSGLELGLNAIAVKTTDWEWNVGLNFTWNTSKITKLNTIDTDNNYVKTGNGGGTGNYLQVHKVGETPNTFFLLKQAYDENGKPLDGKYIAKDGTIIAKEEDSNKYIEGKSSRIPYYYGLSTKVSYKDFELGINGHGAFGHYVFNYTAASQSYDSFYSTLGSSNNVLASTLETGFTQRRLYTDYFLEKGNFFRMDNITLGYTFRKLGTANRTLRVSTGVQNAFVLTKYSGIDPEIYDGIDSKTYQRPRIFMFGFNLNF